MVINYLDVEVKYAQQGKVKQSIKLSEWAHYEFNKRSCENNEVKGVIK